jgi:hypothetical protein
VGAGAADAVGQDQQCEHQEFVGKLRGNLRGPDQAEIPVGEHGAKPRTRENDLARVRADLVWFLQGA